MLGQQMVLSWMAIRGCGFIDPGLGQCLFDPRSGIPDDISIKPSGVVLYIPRVHNLTAVDPILVTISPEGTATGYGIQVTISQTNLNSEQVFF